MNGNHNKEVKANTIRGYMDFSDLSRDQIFQLKQQCLMDLLEEKENRCPSYGELADADEIVSDEIVATQYAGTVFSPEDFF